MKDVYRHLAVMGNYCQMPYVFLWLQQKLVQKVSVSL